MPDRAEKNSDVLKKCFFREILKWNKFLVAHRKDKTNKSKRVLLSGKLICRGDFGPNEGGSTYRKI